MFASFGLGFLAFFWSEFLIMLPIQVFLNTEWMQAHMVIYYFIYSLISAVLAGFGRYWAVWLMNHRTPSLYRAICSAIGFVTFNAVDIIILCRSGISQSLFLNVEGKKAFSDELLRVNEGMTSEEISQKINSLINAQSFDIIIKGINLLMLVFVEAALIVVIYKGLIKKRKMIAVIISDALGFGYIFITYLLGNYITNGVNSIIYNAFCFACGIASLWFVLKEIRYYRRINSYGGIPNEVI